jgi:protein-tyrosine-phosphatase
MHILFVCTGNTCRSAMAEAAARKQINDCPEQYGDISVMSAGVLCAGPSPASGNAILAAAQNDCDLSLHTAKPITEEMLSQADFIFATTRGHKELIARMAPQYVYKLYLLNAFAEGSPDAQDVPDPYGGNLAEYLQCFDVLNSSVAQILKKLT